MIALRACVGCLCLAPLVFCRPAAGAAEEAPVKITLHPAAEPRPALQHQLLPEFKDRLPGNAAVHYGKVTAEQLTFFTDRELWENIQRWQDMPLDELRSSDSQPPSSPQGEPTLGESRPRGDAQLPPLGSIQQQLERAARSEYCDWQLPIREEPFYRILLPELQQCRQFSRLLAAKTRLHVARGEFDEAIRTLRTGYALAQHAAAGETLINGLVGIAISSQMNRQTRDFIQQPGAPNLYWALTMLPRPLVDLRRAVEVERHAVELSFPDVRELDQAEGDARQWSQRLHRFAGELMELSGTDRDLSPLLVTALSVRGYPIAKRGLIEGGLSAEAVEAMPVGQVMLTYIMRTYRELSDEAFKWFFVPYAQAREPMRAAEGEIRAAAQEGREILPVASLYLPAVQSCRVAVVRHEREIAVLRLFEALRIYAAAHDGRLPERLSDIQAVAVPLDPATDQPFTYRREGQRAYLEGPPLPNAPLSYEITINHLP